MRRLGRLAAELGWPVEMLLRQPAEQIEQLQIVAEAWADWRHDQEQQEFSKLAEGR